MPPHELIHPANNYIILSKIGQGSFGSVFKARRIFDGRLFAIKKVKLINMNHREKNNAWKEIQILAFIDNPNIINYEEAYYHEGQLYTVMQFAQNGDLAQRINHRRELGQKFYEFEIWNIGRDILEGINVLHENNILHRDIKPANVFFDREGKAKIGDLNVSVYLEDQLAYTQTGTPYYASPEVWSNKPYSYQCDIWSFGILLYELCSFHQPFRGQNMDEIYMKIKKCEYKQKPLDKYSKCLNDTIRRCLCPRSQRIKINELKKIFARKSINKVIKNNKSYISQKEVNKEILTANYLERIKNLPQYDNQYEPLGAQNVQQYRMNKNRSKDQGYPRSCKKQYERRLNNDENKQQNQNNYPIKRSESEQRINQSQNLLPLSPSLKKINQVKIDGNKKGSLKKFEKPVEGLSLKRRKLRMKMNW